MLVREGSVEGMAVENGEEQEGVGIRLGTCAEELQGAVGAERAAGVAGAEEAIAGLDKGVERRDGQLNASAMAVGANEGDHSSAQGTEANTNPLINKDYTQDKYGQINRVNFKEGVGELSPRGPQDALPRTHRDIILETQLNMDRNELYNYMLTSIGLDSPTTSQADRRSQGLNSSIFESPS